MTTELERAVAVAKQPDPADEAEMLKEALRSINEDLSWFFSCSGAVSRHDMVDMIRCAQKRVDSVRNIVWPPDPNWVEPEPLENDF